VDTVYGPDQPLPAFPEDLRKLAASALDRVLADDSWLRGNWNDPAKMRQWLASVRSCRDVLDPPPASPDVPLFDL
jgi:hypothetical protein